MKNLFALVALVMIAGSIGCTSAPKQEEAPAVAAAQEAPQAPPQIEEAMNDIKKEEQPAAMPEPDPVAPEAVPVPEQTASKSNMSLGTGSSGLGH